TQRYLRAIEEDDLRCLPGTFFYKSFVKQYAEVLGIPVRQIQPGIDLLTEAEPEPASSGQKLPERLTAPKGAAGRAEKPRPPVRALDPVCEGLNREYLTDRRVGGSVAALGAVILACSGFYTWWTRPPRAPKAVQEARAAAVAEKPPAPPAAISVASSPSEASASSDELGSLVLSLSARERTWLSISSGGKEIFSGILQPGETKTVSGLEAARMKVGNAGGLEIRWNGKPVGPIGTSGQVRTIVFTPDNLEFVEPPPPAGASL
ncbi:MAG TPA: RodZ domain-containing protein, partial [Bryobacteraceae bacterium]